MENITIMLITIKDLSSSINNVLKEYLDRDYMGPLWKSLQIKNKNKYLSNLKHNDYINVESFVAFLLGYDSDMDDDFEVEIKRPPKDNILDELYKQYNTTNNKNLLKQMYNYIQNNYTKFKNILKIWSENVWSCSYLRDPRFFKSNMFFSNPKIIKHQWICHFTNNENIKDIKGRQKEFINDLAFTYNVPIDVLNTESGGFAFGYLADDLINLNNNDFNLNYGKNIFMFFGNGIEVYHKTDGEKQVIFNPQQINKNYIVKISLETKTKYDQELAMNDSLYINPYKLESIYAKVISPSGKILFSSYSLADCIKWTITNFKQYQKLINLKPSNINNMKNNKIGAFKYLDGNSDINQLIKYVNDNENNAKNSAYKRFQFKMNSLFEKYKNVKIWNNTLENIAKLRNINLQDPFQIQKLLKEFNFEINKYKQINNQD